MPDDFGGQMIDRVPEWLPGQVRRYLAHTALGQPIRDLAREEGCHASTISRQVRKLEAQRDDLLVDTALTLLECAPAARDFGAGGEALLEKLSAGLFELSQPGAVLVYHAELENPAVICTDAIGETKVTARVDLVVAAVMVLRNWLVEEGGRSIKKYRITAEGRGAVPKLMASRETRAMGFCDESFSTLCDAQSEPIKRTIGQTLTAESPLAGLARRRDRNGKPFLPSDLVRAGERLQEDFEVSRLRPNEILGWEVNNALDTIEARANQAMKGLQKTSTLRIVDVLKDLGPGLGDVVLRCCCLREGLEVTEKRMGWSARSGKVVLRIALQRLQRHYRRAQTHDGLMIG